MSFTLLVYLMASAAYAACLLLSRHLWMYLVIPAVLLQLRFLGETLQDELTGPLWVRHHLSDIGFSSEQPIVAVALASVVTAVKLRRTSALPTATGWHALKMVTGSIASWFTVTFPIVTAALYSIAIFVEIATANPAYRAIGYSGELDWADIAAYTTGLLAVILNYLFVGRKVRKKIAEEQTK